VIPILILLPFGAACLALLLPRVRNLIGVLTLVLSAASGLWLALRVTSRGVLRHDVGGWEAPLGIALHVDGLAAVMLLMSGFVSLPIGLYAASYFHAAGGEWQPGESFWPLALLLLGALHALFLSGDLFNLYVTLELVTLAAVSLVVLNSGESALLASIRYLLAAFVASLFYLFGVAILYAAYGSLDLQVLAGVVGPEPASLVAAALITGGLLLKTALFPLHFWLPRAHAAAPAPVSALLSSLVVTATFYLVVRLWTSVFTEVVTPAGGQLIGALGTGAIVWGSVQALRQQHLKVMIAYSTVAQLGYLFLLVPLVVSALAAGEAAAGWGADAWNGGVYHAISHALAKAAMFLAGGTIAFALGDDRIVGIRGIARKLPISTYAFGIAGMTLIGLPPSGGFVAKWLLLSAAFSSGQWWWAIAMLVGGVLTAGYVFLVLGQDLSLASGDVERELRPVPPLMEYAAMVLALAALGLGVRVQEPLAMLRVGFPFAGFGP
jgi:multicomponent Na+:H+ antiporter subunit D